MLILVGKIQTGFALILLTVDRNLKGRVLIYNIV